MVIPDDYQQGRSITILFSRGDTLKQKLLKPWKEAMQRKRIIFITISAFLLVGGGVLFLLLPYLCDIFILPRLLADLPFSEKEFSLSRISPWEVRGTITLAEEDRPAIAIPRFELHFSPRDLLRGEISSLLFDSASLSLDLRKDRPIISGLSAARSSSTVQQKPSSPLLLPVAFETIIVKNLSLMLQLSDQKIVNLMADGRLGFQYSDSFSGKKLLSAVKGQFKITGHLQATAAIEIQAAADGYEAILTADIPDIIELMSFLPSLPPLQPAGGLSINSRIKLDKRLQPTEHQTSLQLAGFRVHGNAFLIESVSAEPSAGLFVSGTRTKAHYRLTNLMVAKPVQMGISCEGDAEFAEGGFSGRALLLIDKNKTPLTIGFIGRTAPSGTRLEYNIQAEAAHLGANLAALGPITADGVLDIQGTAVSGNINGRIAKISVPSNGAALVDISLKLPFAFPLQNSEKVAPGSLKIKEVRYRNVHSANLQATLSPSRKGLAFTGLLSTPFSSTLEVTCNGLLAPETDLFIGCRLPATIIDASMLPPYVDLGKGFNFNGKISADATYSIEKGLQKGRLSVGFHDGKLNDARTTLEGINFDVVFPQLPQRESDPSQICTIDSIKLGQIHMTDARILFRVESESSLFFEKSTFKWCGGRVETTSFNLSTKMKELETTLYCDRLKFTDLLGQFGIAGAEGQGSLNGRLPLSINSKGLTFDDGFLFSTPGNGGIVRFSNTKQLRQGIPDINQSAYLEYSMRALEDFSYNWTKLTFNSDQQELLITMQLDGKPAEPLPFAYKDGQIVPSTKGPGIEHPIRLDLNFRLPLQEMFQYGKNIQSIMEKM